MPRPTPGTDNRVIRVCRLLNRHRVKFLLIGGTAANLHGSVRATRDVDILVPRDRRNMERLLEALCELPYGIARELEVDDLLRKPFTIVGDDPRVDVLTVAATLTFDMARPRRLVRRIQGTTVPYVNRADLIRSKQTGRPQDEADIERLAPSRRPR